MKKEAIQQVIQDNLEHHLTFPEALDRLLAIGVKKGYKIDLKEKRASYYGEDEEIITLTFPESVLVSSSWSVEKVKETITCVQKKEIDYPTFLKGIAQGGVRYYEVDLLHMEVTYYGSQGEMHCEPFPAFLKERLKEKFTQSF